MRRPPFRKSLEYVAVKDIRLNGGSQIVKAGQDVPKELRIPTLRRLSRRSRIGPKGHPWTEKMLGVKPVSQKQEDLVPQGTGYSQDQWNELLPEQKAVAISGLGFFAAGNPTTVLVGKKGWYTIMLADGTEKKVQGVANASDLLKEQGLSETQIKELLE